MHASAQVGERYVEMALLGAGGMGRVFRARDMVLGRDVALKRVRVDEGRSEAGRRRALREARAGARFAHPRLVRVYDVLEDGGDLVVVMELHEGPSLEERIRQRGPLDLGETATVIGEVAEGLAAAHAAGLVHGDVKPGNVILRADGGGAVLVDFGLAKLSRAVTDFFQAPEWHAPGGRSVERLGGTPGYVAPEQVRGDAASPASDQFALAVTAFECLTGTPPWRGQSATELLAAVVDEPPDLEAIGGLPVGADTLRGLLERGLAREPEARFPDVRALAEALAAANRPSPAASTSTPGTPRASWLPIVLAVVLAVGLVAALATLSTL